MLRVILVCVLLAVCCSMMPETAAEGDKNGKEKKTSDAAGAADAASAADAAHADAADAADAAHANGKTEDKTADRAEEAVMELRPVKVWLNSQNEGSGAENAFDGNMETWAHSSDAAAEKLDQAEMHIYVEGNKVIRKVVMTVYRWDDWCKENLDACKGTYGRLGGLEVSVGGTVCGTVPEYDTDSLFKGAAEAIAAGLDYKPEPLSRAVECPAGASGDMVKLTQMRKGERIMVSEIKIYGRSGGDGDGCDKDPSQTHCYHGGAAATQLSVAALLLSATFLFC